MTTIKAAAVQISPVLYSRDGTVERVIRKIAELGRQGVQFAVFPETIVPYYPYFAFVQRPFELSAQHVQLLGEAVTVPSGVTNAIGDACAAAGMVVSIGVNERDGGTLYNTQLLFDADGRLIPASSASRIESAANRGGTKIIAVFAPVSATAEWNVLKTGMPSTS